MYHIAKQYDVSVQDIINANPGVNPYNLHVGQVIWVPTGDNQWQSSTQQVPQRQTQPQLPQQTQQLMQQVPQQQDQAQQLPQQTQQQISGNRGNLRVPEL